MSQELLERARLVVQQAKKLGAQSLRVYIGRTRESKLDWRDGKVERLRESTRMSLGVDFFVDGRYSSTSTSDLRPQAIEDFLAKSVAMTRVLAKDPHRKLPDPERYEDRFMGDLNLLDDKAISAQDSAVRRKTAKALEDGARSGPGADKIISVTSGCSDVISQSAMVASNGMEGTRQTSYFSMFAETAVKGIGERKPEGWYDVTSRHKHNLPSSKSVGQEATRRALQQIGAKQEKSGEYACVIENRMVGRLVSRLLTPLEGWAIQQKQSFLADKIGQQVVNSNFSLTDDPHVIEGLGSRKYDNEGMSTQMMPIIENGVLKNFYLDTYYASKLGKQPTTGSRTNLVFLAGDRDLPALLREMGTGILITGFAGGSSNSATGDFSYGIRGMWVENGEPVRPLSEMNLAGNHLSFWKKLVELGNDPYQYSSRMCPSMRFDKVQFSGR
jgi:PmbA protein